MPSLTESLIFDPVRDFFDSVNTIDGTHPGALQILYALLLSFSLNCLIATIYKRTYRGTKYSQDYVHTLLILGTLVTLVIMVVRGSQSTAFGMFAAFSIIRFRRSVSQSRDIGFIFFAMATGLAIGAREYTMAAITTPIMCALILMISRRDAFAPRRLSHYLRIRVSNELNYDTAFRPAFDEFLSYRLLNSVETTQAGTMTELRFDITLLDPTQVGAFVNRLQQINGNHRILITSSGDNTGSEL